MSAYIGIDTSNYTTSAAVFDSETNKMISRKKLLAVGEGEIGLMQSKALFCHTGQLPEILEAAFSAFYADGGRQEDIRAVCVSDKPRNANGSYMPVFLAGVSAASAVSSALNIPLCRSSHQAGHILAALYSANRLDLLNDRFAAFHISGGTTELLVVTPDEKNIINCEIAARSLDLKAGQAIDRIGVMMGLPFPAGAELDKLAKSGVLTKKPKISLKGGDCCLSGLQNICERMYSGGESRENTARYAIEFIYDTITAMRDEALKKYGDMPVLYVGGVMSNSIISSRIKDGIFAEPQYSSDNAAGMAMAAYLFCKKERK